MERQSSIIITAILLATVAAAGVVYLLSRNEDPYERELAIIPTEQPQIITNEETVQVTESAPEATPTATPEEETYTPAPQASEEGAVSGIAHVPPTAATGGPLTLALTSFLAGSGIAVTLVTRKNRS